MNRDKLKKASEPMVQKATEADTKIKDLETWAAQASEAKESWKTIKEEAGKALVSSQALDKFAGDKNDDKVEQAGKDLQGAVAAAKEAANLLGPVKKKIDEDAPQAADLRSILGALNQVMAKGKVAKDALDETSKPAAPADAETGSKPPGAPEPAPGATTPAPASQPGKTPATQGEKTPAENALAAATKASEQAATAETEAKGIEKADSLANMKAAAERVVTAAGEAKKQALEAEAQAKKAKEAAKDAEKKPWTEAATAANTAGTDAEALVTAAKAIADKKTTDEVTAAVKGVVTAATKAKGSADTAKTAVGAAKGAQPAAVGETKTTEAKDQKKDEKKEEKKDEKKQVPNSFGLSITAAYSRKFSLDTTMHSKLEVTMVPYPPPQQFLDWIRAHYNKEKP